MSDSYDDRRRGARPPQTAPTQQPRRGGRPAYDDDFDVPPTGPYQTSRVQGYPGGQRGPEPTFDDYEPAGVRPVPAPPRQPQGYGPTQSDDLQEAWRETMTAPPSRQAAAQRQPAPAPDYEEYVDDAPPTSVAKPTLAPPSRTDDEDLVAPSRQRHAIDGVNHAIVPPGSVTGRSLNLVIVIMCFLACLTAGAVYMMNQAASAWLKEVASEVTVQVEARDKTDVDKLVREVAQFLGQQPGIVRVRALSLEENMKLTSEWLPQTDALNTLPVPRLIAVEIDRTAPPDFAAVKKGLDGKFKGVSLDDHRHWQQQIRTVTRSFALGGLAILMLVGAATTAVIVSATRSALSANREIVEVLHFVGATDKFIAREFEKHFLRLGIRAGIMGALAAGFVFLALPFAMQLLGGGTVTFTELQRLIGTGTLDIPGYVLLLVVVVVIATLCMLTSRIGVYRILNSQH